MFQSEEIIRQNIITADAEDEFQIRFIRSEQVGVVNTRSGKSWFILDSKDFWYDLIQAEYPPKKKCSCKNDYFRLSFAYAPRIHTEDYRAVDLTASCTTCGKKKKLGTIEIDYSPSAHLFSQPLTFCPQPKLKCKTYTIQGYWTDRQIRELTDFLLEKTPYLYCWYFHPQDRKRYLRQLTAEELQHQIDGGRYISIFYSSKPLTTDQSPQASDGRGIYVADSVWRKGEVFKLNGPFLVAGYGYFHSMNFCSEYINQNGQIQVKSKSFSALVLEFRKHSKKVLQRK